MKGKIKNNNKEFE